MTQPTPAGPEPAAAQTTGAAATPTSATPASATTPAPDANWHFDTLSVRAGHDPSQHQHSSAVPIYQTAAFTLDSVERSDGLFRFEDPDPLYSRTGNPTVNALADRLKALHPGATGAIAVASGMAAVSYTLLNVAGKGGRVLSNYRLYGGTADEFTNLLPELGLAFDIADDPDDIDAYARAIRDDTKAIYVETISNPQTAIADLEALAELAHAHGIPLIVDNTVATPYLLNPFDFGADVVVYSATKALSGHGDVIAGAVLENGRFDWTAGKHPQFTTPLWFLRDAADRPRSIIDLFPDDPFTGRINALHLNYLGATLSAFSAWLVLRGLETLPERVAKQVSNAQKVAAYLAERQSAHAHVSWVDYPTLPGSPYADLAAKYLPRGAGALVSFGLPGGPEARRRFLESVRLFSFEANIGDAKSLIINPAQTTHIELTDEARQSIGFGDETIRLSLGLENPDDLIADLEQAFAATFG